MTNNANNATITPISNVLDASNFVSTSTKSSTDPNCESDLNHKNAIITRYVALKSLAKVINEQLRDLQPQVTEVMCERYERDGSDRTNAKVNGMEIGSVTLTKSKSEWVIRDREAFIEWLTANGLDDVAIEFEPHYTNEMFALLAENLEPKQFEHMFYITPVASDTFADGVETLDEKTCAFHGLVVPGIEPAYNIPTGIMARPKPASDVWRILSIGSKDGIKRLLLGEAENKESEAK